MPKSKNCAHLTRGSQAINYISGDKLCLLPLEWLRCMDCKQEFLLDSLRGKLTLHPTEESKAVIKWFITKAEEERKRQESPIITPASNIIA